MRRLSLGFTLAEVLITLGVIGVVSALTLPNLSANTLKSQAGPALAKAINTLESTNKMILSEEGATKLSQICGNDYINSCIGNKLQGGRSGEISWTRFVSDEIAKTVVPERSFITKDGMIFFQDSGAWAQREDCNHDKYACSTMSILVDINGPKKPNKVGLDVFDIWLDESGAAIPLGGRQYNDFRAQPNSVPLWNSGYTDNCKKGNKHTSNTGWFCTGSVADNGFKVVHY